LTKSLSILRHGGADLAVFHRQERRYSLHRHDQGRQNVQAEVTMGHDDAGEVSEIVSFKFGKS